MDWIVMNYHHQAELLGRMILACFLGYLIGYERKNRDKSAGMRTHAIVSLGAALIMIVSKYGFMDIPDYDASRVAAQIVSGIGFLGAGVIFVKNNTVSGLTTAAGIWATAGVGMAVGAGAYFVGASAGIMIVLTQVILHKTTFLTAEPVRGYLKMVVAEENEEVLDELQQQFCENKIKQIRMKVNKEKSGTKLEFELVYPAKYDKNVLITQWSKDSRVHTIVG
ncbi:MgtC/SapB family protein [Lacrimispora sp.]|uniref:MgtC/SapB family protein n=1 Tax=Lacrimispora sp. TaxID=2719234 RepID=UPI002FD8D187